MKGDAAAPHQSGQSVSPPKVGEALGFGCDIGHFIALKKRNFQMSNVAMTDKKRTANRRLEEFQRKWQHDKLTAMETLAAESAANDAKTARLRALRLAKAD